MFVLLAERGSRDALLAAVLLATSLVACGPLRFDELPDGGDATVSADANTARDAAELRPDASLDAGVLGPGDAASVDASSDITVVVDVGGLQLGGLPVLLHDSESRSVASYLTGPDGTATIPFVEDGFVTLILPGQTDFAYLSTLKIWAPGTIITFDFSGAERTRSVGVVRVPPLLPFPGAASYSVGFGCAGTESSTAGPAREVELEKACINTTDVARGLATAHSATGRLIAYEWSSAFAPTTTAATEVRFPGQWQEASTLCRLEGSSIPPGATRVDFSCDPVVDGVVYALPRATATVEPGRTLGLDVAGTNDSRFRATTSLRYGNALEDSSSLLSEYLPSRQTNSTTLARDLSTGLLPRVASAALLTTAEPRIVWTLDRPLASGEADAVMAIVGSDHATWTFMLPADAESPFRIPELPEVLATYRPTSEDVSIHFLDADGFAGYEELAERYGMVGLITGYLAVPPLTKARSSGFGGLIYEF